MLLIHQGRGSITPIKFFNFNSSPITQNSIQQQTQPEISNPQTGHFSEGLTILPKEENLKNEEQNSPPSSIQLGHECQNEGQVCGPSGNAICLHGFCRCIEEYVQAGTSLCLPRSKSEQTLLAFPTDPFAFRSMQILNFFTFQFASVFWFSHVKGGLEYLISYNIDPSLNLLGLCLGNKY